MNDSSAVPEPYRICLFGDSHLAALKNFWSDGDHDGMGLAPTFVPGMGDFLTNLVARDGGLHAADEAMQSWLTKWAGVDYIDPVLFDGFAVVGLGLRYQSAITGATAFGIHDEGGGRRLISKPAFAAMMEDRLSAAPAIAVVRLLRAITDKPITVLTQPLPAERFVKRKARRRLDKAKVAIATRLTRPAILRLLDEYDVTVLFEDPNTLAENGLTKDVYALASQSLVGEELAADEDSHMNAEYGGVQLRRLAAHVAAAEGQG